MLAPSATEIHETPISTLAELVRKVAEVEGPVHRDEIVSRIRSAWGLARAGGRIDAHVERAIQAAAAQGLIARDGDFVSVSNKPALLRDRSNVSSTGLRRIEYLPPAEIEQGVIELVGQNFGATEDEVVQAVARQLGYKSTSSQLKDYIAKCVDGLKVSGRLKLEDHILTVSAATAS